MLRPSLEEFASGKAPVPIFWKLPLENLDPFEIYSILDPRPPSFLLESIKGPDRVARYSFLAFNPFLTLQSKGSRITLTEGETVTQALGDPFEQLSVLLKRFHLPRPRHLPPFFGGAIGCLSYDLARRFEEVPCTAVDDLGFPDLFLAFFETVLAIDHAEKTVYLIFCPTPEQFSRSDPRRLYRQGVERLQELQTRLCRPTQGAPGGSQVSVSPLTANLSKKAYIERVKRCQDYISQGDIFQANLSLRLSAEIHSPSPLSLYGALRSINPAPFSAFLDLGRAQLLGSSPERLVRLQGGVVETRPIAGTRPRGGNRLQDHDLRMELLANRKERAEHLMLVDLERNDLGKVCRYGSVKVDEFMVTEQYSHVMHIVTNIHGQLMEDKNSLDVLRAVFPGGTVTGVPKIRCMEIIDELEPVLRGPYTGSIGYISFAGDMDFNIIIRSLLQTGGRIHIQVGAGIVADSDPEQEYRECLYKAEAMLKVVQTTQGEG